MTHADRDDLNARTSPGIPAAVLRRNLMIALGVILGFVAILAAVNLFEFGRVD
jgi:hypothetical protein